MQCHAVDEAADQYVAPGVEQGRGDAQGSGDLQGTRLAIEEMLGDWPTPPRHGVDPPQDRIDLAVRADKTAALDRAEDVALEHHRAAPACGQLDRIGGLCVHRTSLAARSRACPVPLESGHALEL